MDPDGLSIQTLRDAGSVTLRLRGDLDMSTAADLMSAAAAVVEEGADRLVLDMAKVEFVDSSGVNALVLVRRLAQQPDGPAVVVHRPSEAVRSILEITGVGALLGLEG